MYSRLKYHFEPEKGWINDPNGLIFFQGKYHAFFQHNPYAPVWAQMHWGHAVSSDLVNWEELPIALYPDKPYENSDRGGCFSGSAIVKDDVLYLFYTSVSDELGQTQSVVISKDGEHFEKYENNPVIRHFPDDGSIDFRDPKVTKIGNIYYMVCGSGKDGIGKILLFKSSNLLDWEYAGVLLEGKEYGHILECPDLFELDGKYILMFSQMCRNTHSTMFVYGDFNSDKFTPVSHHTPEAGPYFYAPQTFLDDKGRRIIIGWMNNTQYNKPLSDGVNYAGAFSIPREVKITDGKLCTFPVEEAWDLLRTDDELVKVEKNKVTLSAETLPFPLCYEGIVNSVHILRDTKTIEVFINKGTASFTYWFGD